MALKKIVSIILFVCMLSSVLTGCKLFGGGSVNPSDPTGGNNNPTSTNGSGNNGNGGVDIEIDIDLSAFGIDLSSPIDEDGIDWSKYDWSSFDEADLFVSLGNATFTVDNSATATGEFTPGEPLTCP